MIDIQYAAGFFDGEGCVQVGRTLRNRVYPNGYQRPPYYEYQLAVDISNSNLLILGKFADRWGGKIYPAVSSRNKAMWSWHLRRKAAEAFLIELSPWLWVKRYEAWLALNFAAEVYARHRGQGRRLSEEEIALREGYYWALREAKKQGGALRAA